MPSFTQLMITGLQKLSPYVNNISDFFVIIFIMLALWSFIGRKSRFAYIAPSLITSLSFVGVFLSFAIGLSVFNPNFENSVTYLLNSLKAAFMIGVAGYLSHFFIKTSYQQKASRDKASSNGNTPVTPAIIYSVLKKISDHSARQENILVNLVEQTDRNHHDIHMLIQSQHAHLETQTQLLTDIKRHLATDHLNTLTAQLYKLHNSLEHEFHQLQSTTSNGVTELLEALQRLNQSLFDSAKDLLSVFETNNQLIPLIEKLQQQLQEINLLLPHLQGETPLLQLNPLIDSMQQQLQHSLDMMELSLETQLDMADTALENQLNGFTALQESFKILEEQTRESSQIFHKEINTLLNSIHTYSDRFYNKLLTLEHAKFKTQVPFTLPTVLETTTDSTEDWSEHCYSLMESAEYQQAVTCFEKAIQLNPTDFSLHYNKACCHALQEQVELTVLTLQQAIRLNAECLEMAKTDSDFDKVRYHASFQTLLTHKPLSRGQSA